MYRFGDNAFSIVRLDDGLVISADLGDPNYVAYLDWVAAGNVTAPAHPNVAIRAEIEKIERETGVVRVMREGMMRATERAARQDAEAMTAAGTPVTAEQILASNIGYVRTKAVDDRITYLRGMLT